MLQRIMNYDGIDLDKTLDFLGGLEGPYEKELTEIASEKEKDYDLIIKQRRYNIYAGYLRYKIYKEQGGKNPFTISSNSQTISCGNCGSTVEDFIVEEDIENGVSKAVKAMLNLFDWVSICDCGKVIYGNLNIQEQEQTQREVASTFTEENISDVEPVVEIAAVEENEPIEEVELIEEAHPIEEVSVETSQEVPAETDNETTSTNPTIEELKGYKYVQLAELAKGRIPNFRRMSKEELIICLGGDDEEKSRTLQVVRLRTKQKYGSLRDKDETSEVEGGIIAQSENLVPFEDTNVTQIDIVKNNLLNLRQRAAQLLSSESTRTTYNNDDSEEIPQQITINELISN